MKRYNIIKSKTAGGVNYSVTLRWNSKPVEQLVAKHGSLAAKLFADYVRDYAQHLMKNTPKTGRWYIGKSGRKYQASAPGEAPAIDTGTLINSLRTDAGTDEQGNPVGYIHMVGYGLILEFGLGKNIRPRPFIRPSIRSLTHEKAKEIIERLKSRAG